MSGTKQRNVGAGTKNTVSTTMPSYWQSYMDEKVREINALIERSGESSDTFIFITDMHLPVNNHGNSIALVNYLIENTSINKVFFGGDIVHPTSTEIGLVTARELADALEHTNYHMMRGNHDSDRLDMDQIYGTLYCNQQSYCRDLSPDRLYYYTDNAAKKIRYIITDSLYCMSDAPMTSEEQLNWMKERILELDKDWTVLIFHHNIWLPLKTVDLGGPTVDARTLMASIDEVYDKAACNIAGILAGHCHRDCYAHSDKGYALITTTCDCSTYAKGFDIHNPDRPAGTTEEQAFDVVNIDPSTGVITTIRIGAGADRTMTFHVPEKIDKTKRSKRAFVV